MRCSVYVGLYHNFKKNAYLIVTHSRFSVSGQVKWYRDGKELTTASGKYEFVCTGKIRSLVLKNLTNKDAGSYSCKCETGSTKGTLSVKGGLISGYGFAALVVNYTAMSVGIVL